VSVTAALSVPVDFGLKVTEMVQVPEAATPPLQVLVCAKLVEFVPPTAMLVKESAAVPELVSVTVLAALVVPVFWLPNAKLVALKLTFGVPPPAVGQAAFTKLATFTDPSPVARS
jgi:hypothetical protein